VSLPIYKSAVKNYVAVDSEIDSQTVSLPIHKSVLKNYNPADSEIGSQTVSLPIQKSTVIVESFPALIYPRFFFMFIILLHIVIMFLLG